VPLTGILAACAPKTCLIATVSALSLSGVLVPERDHEALARALLDAAQDQHLLSRLARSGAKAVAEKFDQRVQIQKLEEIYLKTIDVL